MNMNKVSRLFFFVSTPAFVILGLFVGLYAVARYEEVAGMNLNPTEGVKLLIDLFVISAAGVGIVITLIAVSWYLLVHNVFKQTLGTTRRVIAAVGWVASLLASAYFTQDYWLDDRYQAVVVLPAFLLIMVAGGVLLYVLNHRDLLVNSHEPGRIFNRGKAGTAAPRTEQLSIAQH